MARWISWCFVSLTGLGTAGFLTGCSTTHPLPPFERPLTRAEIQIVRTTAYTHTESDHLAYGNHNALGGTLHAAPLPGWSIVPPAATWESNAPSLANEEGGFHRALPVRSSVPLAVSAVPTVCGSAAADWSRWPAGTVFRLASTGQVYRVDDYGWALAGRNTIDLYEATVGDMNAWGVRRETIHILQWGDPAESLRMLRGHQEFRHIRRMVLELEGRERSAANLE